MEEKKSLIWIGLSDSFLIIRKRGFFSLISLACSKLIDFISDRRYKIATRKPEQVVTNILPAALYTKVNRYQATVAVPFIKLMKELDFIEKKGNFVDFGSGKGRVLVLAISCGFKNLKGLECSEEFIKISKKNIKQVMLGNENIELIHTDFTNYIPSKDDQFFYIYDPLTGKALTKTFKNIVRSTTSILSPRVLIYQCNLLEDSNRFDYIFNNAEKKLFRIWGHVFIVYIF